MTIKPTINVEWKHINVAVDPKNPNAKMYYDGLELTDPIKKLLSLLTKAQNEEFWKWWGERITYKPAS